MGCLAFIVIAVVIAVIIGLATSGHKANPAQQARDYITAHGSDAQTVQRAVLVVQVDVDMLHAMKTQTALNSLAQDAQAAHDTLDNLRSNFALSTTTDGAVGNDETVVFGAANDLKNAMGALVAYTGSPNAATLAQFTAKYQTAVAEWNSGVSDIWKTAGTAKPPTV